MPAGRKPVPEGEKRARGTLQPCRSKAKVEQLASQAVNALPKSVPVMPDYLSDEARAVWEENIGRVTANGKAKEYDSDLFARYCQCEAVLRQAWQAGGDPPPASFIGEVNKMADRLGIAGEESRVAPKPSVPAAPAPTERINPFARNGVRARG